MDRQTKSSQSSAEPPKENVKKGPKHYQLGKGDIRQDHEHHLKREHEAEIRHREHLAEIQRRVRIHLFKTN